MQVKAVDALIEPIFLGRIGAPFGLLGMVKVYSFTSPEENLLQYKTWTLFKQGNWFEISFLNGRRHGDCLVASLEGISDRDEALALCHSKIAVSRKVLAPLKEDVFYWADLQNLTVETCEGNSLGKVDYLYENAGTDILVVKSEKKESHIPFLMHETVIQVDLAAKRITVDWDFAL